MLSIHTNWNILSCSFSPFLQLYNKKKLYIIKPERSSLRILLKTVILNCQLTNVHNCELNDLPSNKKRYPIWNFSFFFEVRGCNRWKICNFGVGRVKCKSTKGLVIVYYFKKTKRSLKFLKINFMVWNFKHSLLLYPSVHDLRKRS